MKTFFRTIAFLLLCAAHTSARAQYDDPYAVPESPKEANQARQHESRDTQPAAAMRKEYLRVLQDALRRTDGVDAKFWENAYGIVFGSRAGDPETEAKAARLIEQGRAYPLLVDLFSGSGRAPSDGTFFRAGTPDGETMKKELADAMEVCRTAEKPTLADILKAIEKLAPFIRTSELGARQKVIGTCGVLVPPKSRTEYSGHGFCCQHDAPAPRTNVPVRVIPSEVLIPAPARAIFSALMAHASSAPGDRGVVQSLVWAIRHVDKNPLMAPDSEQRRVLNAAMKDGMAAWDAFLVAMGKKTKPEDQRKSLSNNETGKVLTMEAIAELLMRLHIENAQLVDHQGLDANRPEDVDRIIRQLIEARDRPQNSEQRGRTTPPNLALSQPTDDIYGSSDSSSSRPQSTRSGSATTERPPAARPDPNFGCELVGDNVAIRSRVGADDCLSRVDNLTNAGDKPFLWDPSRGIGLTDGAAGPDQPIALPTPAGPTLTDADISIANELVKGFAVLFNERPELTEPLAGQFQLLRPSQFASIAVQELLRAWPVVGNGIALIEALSGRSFFNPTEKLSLLDRSLAFLSIPFCQARILGTAARTAHAIEEVGRVAKGVERSRYLIQGIEVSEKTFTGFERWKERVGDLSFVVNVGTGAGNEIFGYIAPNGQLNANATFDGVVRSGLNGAQDTLVHRLFEKAWGSLGSR